MPELRRRTLAGLATAMAGSVVTGANAQGNTKGAPTVTDPTLIKKLDAVFNAHMDAELAGDLDKTLATMSPNPHLVNIPTMVGGQGPGGVRTFYAKRLIGQFFPPDVKFESISRTYSEERLVDELIISFTHTTVIDWMLPGVKPTGKKVETVFVVIVASKATRSPTSTSCGTRPTCWCRSACSTRPACRSPAPARPPSSAIPPCRIPSSRRAEAGS